MVEFVDLPDNAVVMRIARRSEDQFPPGAKKPMQQLFRPDDFDIEESNRLKRPPLLSVYDTAKTTIAQVKEIRSLRADFAAFGLDVKNVTTLRIPESEDHLRAVEDPHSTEEFGPGADGHAGILGLDRPPGMAKALFKKLRIRLRDFSRRLNESDPVFQRE